MYFFHIQLYCEFLAITYKNDIPHLQVQTFQAINKGFWCRFQNTLTPILKSKVSHFCSVFNKWAVFLALICTLKAHKCSMKRENLGLLSKLFGAIFASSYINLILTLTSITSDSELKSRFKQHQKQLNKTNKKIYNYQIFEFF